jgi:hypothetical protein
MPGAFQTSSPGGVPGTGALPAARSFVNSETPYFEYPYSISGITRGPGGVLPNCTVVLFRTADNSVAGITTSDANGYYTISASPNVTHYVVAYLPGAPDVAGTTVNTIVGA